MHSADSHMMRIAASITRLPNNHLLQATAEPMATLLKQGEMKPSIYGHGVQNAQRPPKLWLASGG
jgi:hypothetical protein